MNYIKKQSKNKKIQQKKIHSYKKNRFPLDPYTKKFNGNVKDIFISKENNRHRFNVSNHQNGGHQANYNLRENKKEKGSITESLRTKSDPKMISNSFKNMYIVYNHHNNTGIPIFSNVEQNEV